MKNKIYTILTVAALACLLLLCMVGCQEQSAETKTPGNEGGTVTIIGGQEEPEDLEKGIFSVLGKLKKIISKAHELGGSKTLEIDLPEDETLPDQEDTTETEPQWQPGIW